VFDRPVTYVKPNRATDRPLRFRRGRITGLLAAATAVVIAYQAQTAPTFSPSHVPQRAFTGEATSASLTLPRLASGSSLDEDDGTVPDGTTVFDDDVPGVANLDPDLLNALRRAAADAAAGGVHFVVNSGWRSPAYQEQLRRQAVAHYGSEAEAARWVATPTTSPHVAGDAVDLGPVSATPWLAAHGAAYGLCRIYGNEPWHFELRPAAASQGCPPVYADPTQDPRMQP
jgi:uncharacterized protein YcbK (DUF882 family)